MKCLKHNIPKNLLITFLRKSDTNEHLRLEEYYTLANVEKFFLKTKNHSEKEMYTSPQTIHTKLNAKNEFKTHFYENIEEIKASTEIRIS